MSYRAGQWVMFCVRPIDGPRHRCVGIDVELRVSVDVLDGSAFDVCSESKPVLRVPRPLDLESTERVGKLQQKYGAVHDRVSWDFHLGLLHDPDAIDNRVHNRDSSPESLAVNIGPRARGTKRLAAAHCPECRRHFTVTLSGADRARLQCGPHVLALTCAACGGDGVPLDQRAAQAKRQDVALVDAARNLEHFAGQWLLERAAQLRRERAWRDWYGTPAPGTEFRRSG